MELTSTNRPKVLYTLFFLNTFTKRLTSLSGLRRALHLVFINFLGGDSMMETPVPIPNTVVKHPAPTILAWRRAGKIGTAKGNFKGR